MGNFCEHCGSPLENGARFCPGCGQPVNQTEQPTNTRSNSKPVSPKKTGGFGKKLLIPAIIAAAVGGVVMYLQKGDTKGGNDQNVPQVTSTTQNSTTDIEEIERPSFGEEGYEAKSDRFTGSSWSCSTGETRAYGSVALNENMEKAMDDAVSNAHIKLEKNGDFSVISLGKNYETREIAGADYTVSIDVNMALSGHIDKSTGDGTFTMMATAIYHHTSRDSYEGDDDVDLTFTYDVNGKIVGDIGSDDTFNPRFDGKGTVTQYGIVNHTKGKAAYDTDKTRNIEHESRASVSLRFYADN